ncbi:MAG: hypothetical protein M0Z73_02550 [Betaproteobacteria bacterium]|nr:hypothetical protein [Betaproteobacteria bacterium]
MRPKKTTGRGFGVGALVEELAPFEDFEEIGAEFSVDAEGLRRAVAEYMARRDAPLAVMAEVKQTLEALKNRGAKPEQLDDVDPITEGLLIAGRKDLARLPLESWTADELADAATKALRLVTTKGGRPKNEAARMFVDELLGLWLAAGNAFPPNPSASSELSQKPDFHQFVQRSAELAGCEATHHQISEAIKARTQ